MAPETLPVYQTPLSAPPRIALKDLVSRNYTGDIGGYESALQKYLETDIGDSLSAPASSLSTAVATTQVSETATIDPNKKLTRDEARAFEQAERDYKEALAFIKDAIAPPMIKVDASKLQIGDIYVRSFFTYAYPDFLDGNWLSPLINWDVKFDMAMYIYPVESAEIAKYLRTRLTQLYSTRSLNQDKGLLNDPALDAQIQDVEELRQALTRGQERYFHFSIYTTIYADTEEQLKKLANTYDSLLSGRNILTKQAYLRSEQAFIATGPFAKDEVGVYRNISTKGLSTTFPFTSNTLSQNEGVLYGINTHNNSLIIFDRFRTENANMTVFAKSG